MKLKEGFKLREICGEYVISAEGVGNIDYSELISFNESAALLWRKAEKGDFSVESLTKVLTENYEVDDATAEADVKSMLEKWQEQGLIEA